MIVIVVQLWVISSIPSSTLFLVPTSKTKVGVSRTDTAIKASADRCGALFFFWVLLKSIYMYTHSKEEDDDLYKFDPDKEPWWNRWERPTFNWVGFFFNVLFASPKRTRKEPKQTLDECVLWCQRTKPHKTQLFN